MHVRSLLGVWVAATAAGQRSGLMPAKSTSTFQPMLHGLKGVLSRGESRRLLHMAEASCGLKGGPGLRRRACCRVQRSAAAGQTALN